MIMPLTGTWDFAGQGAKKGMDLALEELNAKADFQSRVAVEAIRGESTISPIASRLEGPPSPVRAWKQPALEGWKVIFSKCRGVARPAEAPRREARYAPMGRFQMEGPGLKKSGSAAPLGPAR